MRRGKPSNRQHWRRAWAGASRWTTSRRGQSPHLSGRGRSLKRPFSVLAIVFLAFSLAACASRPETGFLSAVAYSPPGAVDHTLLVATTRERDDRPGTLFNGDRASGHELRRDHGLDPAEPQDGRDRMGVDAARRSQCRLRRPRRKISRRRQGVRSGAERATCAPAAGTTQGLPVHPRLQYDVRRGGLPAGAARPRFESSGRPGAVHLGVARTSRRPMSTTSTARPPPATASSTRSVCCSPATRKR